MAGGIPQEFIDRLLAQTDIVDLVGAWVPLKKSGRDFSGLCPFHEEKTPSFTVSPAKQFYYCFGCGASGNAIGFLMRRANLEFPQAVAELAERLGLQIPRGTGGEREDDAKRRGLYECMEQAVAFFRRQLHERGAVAQEYLRKRGVDDRIAAEFELGYAPPGNRLLVALAGMTEDGGARRRAIEAGLLVERDNSVYDYFRNRLVFPIRSHVRGRIVGFGARSLGGSEPKYLNSPETPIFRKGRELYGLHRVLRQESRPASLYVVEGYMDVLALAQHGIDRAVAALGTALGRTHLELLLKRCPQPVLCFDGDEAGRRAAERALETTLPLLRAGMQVKFMFLPQGEDPDSYVRTHGKERFEDAALRIDLSEFLMRQLGKGLDPRSAEGRGQMAERAAKALQPLRDPILRRLFLEQLAPRVGLGADYLDTHLPRAAAAIRGEKDRPRPPRGKRSQVPSLLRSAVKLLLHKPELAGEEERPQELRQLTSIRGIDFLAELIETLRANPKLHCGAIVQRWHDTDYGKPLRELAAEPLLLGEGADLRQEFLDALRRLRERHRKQRRAQLMEREPGELTEQEKDELQVLQEAPRA